MPVRVRLELLAKAKAKGIQVDVWDTYDRVLQRLGESRDTECSNNQTSVINERKNARGGYRQGTGYDESRPPEPVSVLEASALPEHSQAEAATRLSNARAELRKENIRPHTWRKGTSGNLNGRPTFARMGQQFAAAIRAEELFQAQKLANKICKGTKLAIVVQRAT
jgi:hypothetical protein